MPRYSSLRELYLIRLREFYRQPARIFWVYGFPTLLAVVLGVAFNNRPPEALRVVVVEGPGVAPIRAALDAPEAKNGRAGRPGLTYTLAAEETALDLLRTGKTPLVVEPRTSGGVVYRYDTTRPEANAARDAVDDVLQRAAGRGDPVPVDDRTVTEPGARYIDFLIPGLIGLNIMGGGLWGVGFLMVNMRIAKLLKRFAATPMPRYNFLLAVLGARLTFLFPDVAVLLLLGVLGFHMPIRGSLLLVALVVLMGALAFAGIGLLIASQTQTTETVSGLMNLTMIPMWLLSGVFFSTDRYPAQMQWLIQALPLTPLTSGLRLVILDGAGLFNLEVLKALAILAAWAVGTFLLALRFFRWT
jgi:ABC-2 type transport system permease protein